MSLRLLEVTLPSDGVQDAVAALRDTEVVDAWTAEAQVDRGLVRALVPSERVEEVTDLLTERWGDDDCFRVVLLKVEATIPSVDENRVPREPVGGDGPSRVSREELYADLSAGAQVTPVYLVTVGLSTVVAATGLLRSDVAVIIGAMVIAPLLAPNVALSLAATLGDLDLARKAGGAAVSGAAVALGLSILLGLVLGVEPSSPELFTRSHAGIGDVALGLAAGSAGALAYTTGLPAALIGVMVAVALLPPLVATGLFLGAGMWPLAVGAGVLTVTNVTAVNLAGVVTFLAQEVRPRTWWEQERARTARKWALGIWIALLVTLIGIILLLLE